MPTAVVSTDTDIHRNTSTHIVMKHGTQPNADQDYEFTDRNALTQFVDYYISKAAMKTSNG